jgi:hypothetical protein
VFDKQFAAVDALLAANAACFSLRAFSEDYAARSAAIAKRKGDVCAVEPQGR